MTRFAEMIRRAWAGGQRNLYCCSLANPQGKLICPSIALKPEGLRFLRCETYQPGHN